MNNKEIRKILDKEPDASTPAWEVLSDYLKIIETVDYNNPACQEAEDKITEYWNNMSNEDCELLYQKNRNLYHRLVRNHLI